MTVKKIESLLKAEDIDFKDCLFIKKTSDNIHKWIRYHAFNYGDADCVIKKNELFRQLNWPDKYIDCIFSFKSYFYGFLRGYLKFFYDEMLSPGYILDHYVDLFSRQTMLKILINECKISDKEANNFWERLNDFAKLTHTIGNYMPCPDSEYNRIKGFGKGYQHFQDRIDLLYLEINSKTENVIEEEKKKFYNEWFSINKKLLYIEEMIKNLEFLCPMRKQGRFFVCYMETGEDIRNYSDYMSKVNKLIRKRGDCIIDNYKKKKTYI